MKTVKFLLYTVLSGLLLRTVVLASASDIRKNLDNGSDFCYATSSLQAYADYLEYIFATHDYAYKTPIAKQDSVKLKNQKRAYHQVCRAIDYIKGRSGDKPDLDKLLTLINDDVLKYKKGEYNNPIIFSESLFYFLELQKNYFSCTKEEITPSQEWEKPTTFEPNDLNRYFIQFNEYRRNNGQSGSLTPLMNPKYVKPLIAIEDTHGSVHTYKLLSGLFSTPNYCSHFIAFVSHRDKYRIYDSLDHDKTNQLHDLPTLAKIISKEMNASSTNRARSSEVLILMYQKVEEEESVYDTVTTCRKSQQHTLGGISHYLTILAFRVFFSGLLTQKKHTRRRKKTFGKRKKLHQRKKIFIRKKPSL